MLPDLPRHLSGLTSQFGKDIDQERLLQEVNQVVEPLQRDLEAACAESNEPLVFILGPPRSSTTLVSQLLYESNGVSVITNLAAKFWMAPAFGLMLSSALIPKSDNRVERFKSKRGTTEGLWEPHEFGYFWSRWFDVGQETHFLDAADRRRVDVGGLIRAVRSMQAVVGKPIAFKNNTWFSFQADFLAELFPRAIFLSCKRDPFFVAQSIWLQRIDLFGEPSRWWSVRPPDYRDILKLPPLEQVARQVVSIECTTKEALAKINPARVVEIEYERASGAPRQVLLEIAALVEDSCRKKLKMDVGLVPERFDSTNQVRLDQELAGELRAAIDKWQIELNRGTRSI